MYSSERPWQQATCTPRSTCCSRYALRVSRNQTLKYSISTSNLASVCWTCACRRVKSKVISELISELGISVRKIACSHSKRRSRQSVCSMYLGHWVTCLLCLGQCFLGSFRAQLAKLKRVIKVWLKFRSISEAQLLSYFVCWYHRMCPILRQLSQRWSWTHCCLRFRTAKRNLLRARDRDFLWFGSSVTISNACSSSKELCSSSIAFSALVRSSSFWRKRLWTQ